MPLTINECLYLIETYGPIMKLHPNEKYLMDDPEAFLDAGLTALSRALAYNTGENDYDTFKIQDQSDVPIPYTGAFTDLWHAAQNDPRRTNPAFRYWMTVNDAQKPGNQSRAIAQVRVNETDTYVDLEFWFFYPFNGPGKFRVTVGSIFTDYVEMDTCGRHYGDWEHVTVRLVPAPTMPSAKVQSVYLSRHTDSIWITDLTQLQFKGVHPVVYVARDSHAHYPTANPHIYYLRPWSYDFKIGTAAVDLYDMTADGGTVFDASQRNNYQMIRLEHGGVVDPAVSLPAWYYFGPGQGESDDTARWGQYEKLSYSYDITVVGTVYTYTQVGSGPHGPGQHGPD
jgi:hypothetical protein